MIITNLLGGLGNQMFQYAAGRSLSLRNGTALRLDVSDFVGYDLHQGFELQRVFHTPIELATARDVQNILGWQSSRSVRRILLRLNWALLRRQGLIVEPHFNYWPELINAPRESYLLGYWQSEKYFKDYSAMIRSDFTFRYQLEAVNKELAEAIGQSNAVSVHIRRGDYANNSKTKATHGLCSLDYYQTAIKYMAERVECPQFFVFSDDINWAEGNLKINYPSQFIGHNQGAHSYIDMQLMSICKHHIIANSSFSWWGAWLNINANKIVIAPKRWFVKQTDVRDLFPQEWVTL
jgi:hypothetical protein